MTNPNLTLIAALLDRSGSMERCKTATETGFDEIISKHRSEPGEAIVTLSMFDDRYDNVYANVPIAAAPPLTLVPRNMTAMLDAIGPFHHRDRRTPRQPKRGRPSWHRDLPDHDRRLRKRKQGMVLRQR